MSTEDTLIVDVAPTEPTDAVPAPAAAEPAAKAASTDGPNPNKKRKIALFLSYVGHGYQGMQRNPGAKTIEDDLFCAIQRAGGISEANADERGYTKVHWSRAARTDKGVSAVGQVVSLMMVLNPPGVVDRINAELPPQIRVYGCHRTVKGFDARKACDKRRYEYILPAWMFAPVPKSATAYRRGDGPSGDLPNSIDQPAVPALEAEAEAQAVAPSVAVGDDAASKANKKRDPATSASALLKAEAIDEDEQPRWTSPPDAPLPPDPSFVFDSACTQKLTSILRGYEGTHNFHNYTVRMAPTSPQAQRYILDFSCQGTFFIGGKPWVRMVVLGQSFMLHQIRKMVGMAVAEFTGVARPGSVRHALNTPEKMIVPMAPDLGLFLDECLYGAYNERWGEHQEVLNLGDYSDRVVAFKDEQLYPMISKRDEEERVNATWRTSVTESNFQFSKWPLLEGVGEIGVGNKRGANGGGGPEAKRAKGVAVERPSFNPEYSD